MNLISNCIYYYCREVSDKLGWASNFMVLGGSSGYTYVRMTEMKAKKEASKQLTIEDGVVIVLHREICYYTPNKFCNGSKSVDDVHISGRYMHVQDVACRATIIACLVKISLKSMLASLYMLSTCACSYRNSVSVGV